MMERYPCGQKTSQQKHNTRQVLLDAIEQGYADAYSGELIASVPVWIDLQAGRHVGFTLDPIKRATVRPYQEMQTAIHRWYYDKFFLHSKFGLAEETKI